MATHKLGFKVPPFHKDDYNNWKMKMLFYIRAVNPLYIRNLDNGPHVPMKIIPESVENGVRIPQKSIPKEKSKFTKTDKEDKEYITHDHNLQLIIANTINKTMTQLILGLKSSKQMWDVVECSHKITQAYVVTSNIEFELSSFPQRLVYQEYALMQQCMALIQCSDK